MNIRWLLHRNIRYFARYYRLVAMAVVITVAVIVGSLVVGDSVRMTLVRRVTERLGNTETIIFSRSSFISDSILSVSLLGESARGVLLTDGFISRNGKLVPVFVWGVDDLSLSEGSAKIEPGFVGGTRIGGFGRYSATFTGDRPGAFRLSFRDQELYGWFAPVL